MKQFMIYSLVLILWFSPLQTEGKKKKKSDDEPVTMRSKKPPDQLTEEEINVMFGSKSLKCLVCQALVDEIEVAIEMVDPRKKTDTSTYTLTASGDRITKTVPYARSETHLTEIHDTICKQFDNYAQAKEKTTGEPTIIRIMSRMGGMNPRFSEVDIVPDMDLNTRLQFYCENLVETLEDDIMELFRTERSDYKEELCAVRGKVCKGELSRVADDDLLDKMKDKEADRKEKEEIQRKLREAERKKQREEM